MRRAFLLLPALFAVARQAFGQRTQTTLDQIATAKPGGPLDPLIMLSIGGRIFTAKAGAGLTVTSSPMTGYTITAQPDQVVIGIMPAIQPDKSFLVPGPAQDILQVHRNGLLQAEGLDYKIDTANPLRIVPTATLDPWTADDVVQVSYRK